MSPAHFLQVKGQGRSKEGFSIFGIFDRTVSKGGKACLKEWFQVGLTLILFIEKRQVGLTSRMPSL